MSMGFSTTNQPTALLVHAALPKVRVILLTTWCNAAVDVAAGVYHLAAGIAGQFVDMAVPTAFWTCLSASAAAVAVAGIQIRSSFMVDPER